MYGAPLKYLLSPPKTYVIYTLYHNLALKGRIWSSTYPGNKERNDIYLHPHCFHLYLLRSDFLPLQKARHTWKWGYYEEKSNPLKELEGGITYGHPPTPTKCLLHILLTKISRLKTSALPTSRWSETYTQWHIMIIKFREQIFLMCQIGHMESIYITQYLEWQDVKSLVGLFCYNNIYIR